MVPELVMRPHLDTEGERTAALLREVMYRGVEDGGRSVKEGYKIGYVVRAWDEDVL